MPPHVAMRHPVTWRRLPGAGTARIARDAPPPAAHGTRAVHSSVPNFVSTSSRAAASSPSV